MIAMTFQEARSAFWQWFTGTGKPPLWPSEYYFYGPEHAATEDLVPDPPDPDLSDVQARMDAVEQFVRLHKLARLEFERRVALWRW